MGDSMNKCIASLILFFIVGSAQAEPIKNLEVFEGQVQQCIKGKSPDVCLNKLLPSRFPPGNEGIEKSINQVSSLLVQWLGEDKIYAVHPVKKIKTGDIFERRIYAIEGANKGFMILDSSYLKIQGELYLFAFNLSSKEETVDAVFKDKL